jgi:hypothetical protein
MRDVSVLHIHVSFFSLITIRKVGFFNDILFMCYNDNVNNIITNLRIPIDGK